MTATGSLRTNENLTFVDQTEFLRILKWFHLLFLFKESSLWKKQAQGNNVMLRVHSSVSFQTYFCCAEIKPVFSSIF